jgi:thiosulfate/3-mercaptopyruvate sulfurtransferase
MSHRDHLLAETAWLAERLHDPTLRLVDIRGEIRPPDQPQPWYRAKREEYLAGHIPGAIFIDWLEDIVEPDAPIRMTVASPPRFRALMERLGIGDEHKVVAYDDGGGSTAARLWWVLNYYGHPAAKLLNGGYAKWVAEGRPVTADIPAFPPARFSISVKPEWRGTGNEVRRALGDQQVRLVDCRGPREFQGEIGRGERKGRIPGAVNVPVRHLFEREHKTFKGEAELRRLYEGAGVTPDKAVITYCNAGIAASLGLFALRLLGYPAACNFAGSWNEWEHDPTNPTETG